MYVLCLCIYVCVFPVVLHKHPSLPYIAIRDWFSDVLFDLLDTAVMIALHVYAVSLWRSCKTVTFMSTYLKVDRITVVSDAATVWRKAVIRRRRIRCRILLPSAIPVLK